MQILDDAGQKILGSVSAKPIETSVWQGFCDNADKPQPAGERELLFADRISGGILMKGSSASVPDDLLSLMHSPINSTNIGEVTTSIKATGVSSVFFYAYTVNEGGGLGKITMQTTVVIQQ